MDSQLSRHGHFGDLSSAAHGQVEEPAAPLRLTSYRNLRRLHQQKPEQRVALFADVSQSPPIPTGLLRRYQSHIAGHLLATVETFRSSDHQLEGERRQRSDSGMRHHADRQKGHLRRFHPAVEWWWFPLPM